MICNNLGQIQWNINRFLGAYTQKHWHWFVPHHFLVHQFSPICLHFPQSQTNYQWDNPTTTHLKLLPLSSTMASVIHSHHIPEKKHYFDNPIIHQFTNHILYCYQDDPPKFCYGNWIISLIIHIRYYLGNPPPPLHKQIPTPNSLVQLHFYWQ